MGRYTVISYANSTFIQMFLWERFNSVAPQPTLFEAVNLVTVEDVNGIVKTVPNKPEKMRAQRWSNLKQQKGKKLVDYIDSEKHFHIRPYTSTPRGIMETKLYAALGGEIFLWRSHNGAFIVANDHHTFSLVAHHRVKIWNCWLQPSKSDEAARIRTISHPDYGGHGLLGLHDC